MATSTAASKPQISKRANHRFLTTTQGECEHHRKVVLNLTSVARAIKEKKLSVRPVEQIVNEPQLQEVQEPVLSQDCLLHGAGYHLNEGDCAAGGTVYGLLTGRG
eukprot:49267-Amphidinium_carterae.1